ncbi:Uncharacterized protein PBTT_02027 [Plasmodiophora brassicae]|nr:secrectory protein [Plasmodiophora brassicae]CEP02583.1 hypothetical protein PBRA_002550 [Plasmodiophora brassicae]
MAVARVVLFLFAVCVSSAAASSTTSNATKLVVRDIAQAGYNGLDRAGALIIRTFGRHANAVVGGLGVYGAYKLASDIDKTLQLGYIQKGRKAAVVLAGLIGTVLLGHGPRRTASDHNSYTASRGRAHAARAFGVNPQRSTGRVSTRRLRTRVSRLDESHESDVGSGSGWDSVSGTDSAYTDSDSDDF